MARPGSRQSFSNGQKRYDADDNDVDFVIVHPNKQAEMLTEDASQDREDEE